MSKRDNPRLKQREAEKQQKRESYNKSRTVGEERGSRAAGRSGEGRSAKTAGRGGEGRSAKTASWGGEGRSAKTASWSGETYAGKTAGRGSEKRESGSFKKNAGNSSGLSSKKEFGGALIPGRAGNRFEDTQENPNLIIGRNPVMEAVKSGRQIEKLLMQKDGEGSVRKIAAMAREKKILIQYVDRLALDRLCPGRPHQGVAAFAAAHDYCEIEDILAAARSRGEDPFIILLDGLEDPHNLGAIMRTADAAGAHGIIIPARRAVGLTETVAKASAGAIEYVPVAKVGNIVQAIERLKEEGLWIAACDMDGQCYYEAELSGPMAVVVGGEGQGVSRLVREKCDYVLSIPMKGRISSLNASNAAAILMYEVYRRRAVKGQL